MNWACMQMLFPLLISVPKQEKLQIQSSGLDDPLLEGGSTAEEIEGKFYHPSEPKVWLRDWIVQ